MPDTERVIAAEIEDPRTVFVFHQKVVARSWLRRAFGLTPRRTLAEERFVAWDDFRRRTFRYPSALREADEPFRTLFLAALLHENRERGLFQSLIAPEHREASAVYLRSLRRVLPSLYRLEEIDGGALEPGKRADLRLLQRRYRQHLQASGRFEPAWEQPPFEPGPWSYRILHPEVIEELPFHAARLAPHPQVRVEPTDFSLVPLEPRLEDWPSAPEELGAVLLRVGELLDGGTPPEEIVLTVAGLEAVEPELRVLAGRHGVPLSFHQRKPVSRYPEGQLFPGIAALAESGFSLEALKALLLNRALPWRAEERARELVRFGVEQRILRNHPLRGVELDLWENAFRRCLAAARQQGSRPQENRLLGLQGFYRQLRDGVAAVVAAPGFLQLQTDLERFADTVLDKARWSPESTRIHQFTLNTLKDLVSAAGAGDFPVPPFALWLEYLQDQEYVPQERQASVQVYPYRVTAGIHPAHHFVLNVSQGATRRVVDRYPFLSLQEQPPGTPQTDLSDTYLRLYSLSGGEVRFSFSRATVGGAQLPASFFLGTGRITAPAAAPADPYELERAMWAGAAAPAPRLYPRQKEGLRRALATGLGAKGLDLTARRLNDEGLLARIRERLSRDGVQTLSPTQLEAYLACPFQYLFRRGLGLEEGAYTPVFWEPREFGGLLHRVFHRFFQAQAGKPLRPEQGEELQRRMGEAVEEELAAFERDNPLPVAPIWEEKRRQVRELASAFLEQELREMPGQEVLATEHTLDLELPGEGLRLTGTVDRLSRVDGRLGITDFKKKGVPGRSDIFGEEPVSFQLPFYLLLLARSGEKPEWAAYYSIEDRQHRWVYHPQKPRPYADEAQVEEAVARVEQLIRQAVRGIREGEFRPAERAGKTACPFCPLRGLCRGKFASME